MPTPEAREAITLESFTESIQDISSQWSTANKQVSEQARTQRVELEGRLVRDAAEAMSILGATVVLDAIDKISPGHWSMRPIRAKLMRQMFEHLFPAPEAEERGEEGLEAADEVEARVRGAVKKQLEG